jgi:glycosyltransferase involved in cell wall biosynthesis
MDVFALPSFYEGSPVSAVEAAANGLPLVLSSTITKEIQFLSNVAYANISNSEEWARAIIDMAARGRDLNSESKINEHGFNVKAIAKLLADAYIGKISG